MARGEGGTGELRGGGRRRRRTLLSVCEALETREMLSTVAPLQHSATSAVPTALIGHVRAGNQPAISAAATSSAAAATRSAALTQALQRVMDQYHIPGALAGVWTPGKPLWLSAQGYADVASGEPMSLRDRVQIRSATKSFTVTLVLQLARAQRLSLSDPISKYVPGIPNGDRITLAELAGMTSGVKNYTDVDAFRQKFGSDFAAEWTNQEIVDLTIPSSPVFSPGAQYNYSNTNTVLLGMAVEKVTGRPLAQTLNARIFRPLGLTKTAYIDGLPDVSPTPTNYEVDPKTGELEVLPKVNLSALGPSGAMVSTLPDMLRWGRALGTGRLIGPQLLQLREQTSRPATDGPEYDRYGLGMGELNGWWGHTGDGIGAQVAIMFDPVTRSVIAVSVNSTQPVNVATQIFKALANVVRPGSGPESIDTGSDFPLS